MVEAPLRTLRSRASGLVVAAGLFVAIGLGGGSASANGISSITMDLLARTVVDGGSNFFFGQYNQTTFQAITMPGSNPDEKRVKVLDFFFPDTPQIGLQNFRFDFTTSPGADPTTDTYTDTNDVWFTWDMTTGTLVADPVRVRMQNVLIALQGTAYYDVVMSTNDTSQITCVGNAVQAFDGEELPTGWLPDEGAPTTVVASACPLSASDDSQEGFGFVVDLPAFAVPEPSTALLVTCGLVALARSGRRRSA